MGEQVEQCCSPSTDAQCRDHKPKLRDRGVGQHLLDVLLYEGQHGAKECRDCPDHGQRVDRGSRDGQALKEHGVQTSHHVHTRNHHGGGVNKRRDWGRASHGIGKPGMQDELPGLGHDRRDEAQRTNQQQVVRNSTLIGQDVEVQNRERLARSEVQHDDAHQQTNIAHTVRQERLERSIRVRLFFPPMADQRKGADSNQLPANNHLQGVLAEHEEQHGGSEQTEECEVVRVPTIPVHVIRAEYVHQQRDQRHDNEQQNGLAVHQRANRNSLVTILEPVHTRDHWPRRNFFVATLLFSGGLGGCGFALYVFDALADSCSFSGHA